MIEAITGKTITLSWKKPKRPDPSFGIFSCFQCLERPSRNFSHSEPTLLCADSGSLLYMVQQQPLGSIQWSVVASNLRETNYTVTSLSKGVRYAFRVLASTGKTSSKPSQSTDLVQLLDKGNKHEVFLKGPPTLQHPLKGDSFTSVGPYLRRAPIILDKPDIVYMVENQPASITITLNHVHAVVTWKRLVPPSSVTSCPGMKAKPAALFSH